MTGRYVMPWQFAFKSRGAGEQQSTLAEEVHVHTHGTEAARAPVQVTQLLRAALTVALQVECRELWQLLCESADERKRNGLVPSWVRINGCHGF